MFEINDNVKVIVSKTGEKYRNTYGKEGIIDYIDYHALKYGVILSDISNPDSRYGRFYFDENELELVKVVDEPTMGCRTNTINTERKNNIKNTFMVKYGTRKRTPQDNTREREIKTITTTVRTCLGVASTTCDASSYDHYLGALVAAAKTTASKSEEAGLIYNMAIVMWGTEMCTNILRSLANRAFGKVPFDSAYKKWCKSIAYEKRIKDERERTCCVCGKMFATIDEARAHEQWHKECKRNRAERKAAKIKLAELEREGRIEEIMCELISKRNEQDNKED